jgi:hypothetical protein
MELHPNLIGNPAILAAVLGPSHGPSLSDLVWHGETSWRPLLQGALLLIKTTSEPYIRIVVGDRTVVIQREGEHTYGVVIPTGDPIAKSLHRMIRRAANPGRRERKPVVQLATNTVDLRGGAPDKLAAALSTPIAPAVESTAPGSC